MRILLVVLAGCLAAALAGWFLWRPARVVTLPLRVATGKLTNPPNHVTKFLLDRAARHRLRLELVDVAGSEQSLDLVEAGRLDAAVVRGGIRLGGRRNVRQLTALDVEVFQLLVRGELAGEAEVNPRALRGKRISINRPATGTHAWSLDLLDFLGLGPTGPGAEAQFTPLTLENGELLRLCDRLRRAERADPAEAARLRAELPDAVVFGGPAPSGVPGRLIRRAGYRVLPMPFARAYIQARKHDGFASEALDPAADLEVAVVPAFTYGVSPPIPPRDAPAVGLRRLVVAHKDAGAEALVRLLRAIYLEHGDGSLDPVELGRLRPQYELHPAVGAFRDEQEQVLQKRLTRFAEKAASLLGGVIGAAVAVWGYFRWRRLLRFEKFFHDLLRVNRQARGLDPDPAAPSGEEELVRHLRGRLAEIRCEVVREFAAGRLQGESLLLSLLTLISDSEVALPHLVRLGPAQPPGGGG